MNGLNSADKRQCGANPARTPACGRIFTHSVDLGLKNFQSAMLLP